MRGENRVRLHLARCFELSDELFFGKDSKGSVLFAVLGGFVKIKLCEESVVLSENNLMIKSQGRELAIETSASATVLVMEFEGFSEFEIFDRVIPLGKIKRRYLGEMILEMSRNGADERELIFDFGSREGNFGEREILENALSSLLIRIVRDSVSQETDSAEDFEVRTQAQALRRYLYENFRTKISLDGLSFIFRSNKTTICKQFREEYGITVFEYLNGLRVEEAKKMLTEGVRSVTEIADQLGFESIHYFTRFFKKTTGMSPSDYKRTVGRRRRIFDDE